MAICRMHRRRQQRVSGQSELCTSRGKRIRSKTAISDGWSISRRATEMDGIDGNGYPRVRTDVVGVLDRFSVGERIGEGNSKLDHVGAPRFHREHHRDRRSDRRVTSREESNENGFILSKNSTSARGRRARSATTHERGLGGEGTGEVGGHRSKSMDWLRRRTGIDKSASTWKKLETQSDPLRLCLRSLHQVIGVSLEKNMQSLSKF